MQRNIKTSVTTITTCSDFLLFVRSCFFYTVVCVHVKDLMREHEKPHAILTCFSLFFSRVINWGKLIFSASKKQFIFCRIPHLDSFRHSLSYPRQKRCFITYRQLDSFLNERGLSDCFRPMTSSRCRSPSYQFFSKKIKQTVRPVLFQDSHLDIPPLSIESVCCHPHS